MREYPNKIWPYRVQYLHFRILNFSLIIVICTNLAISQTGPHCVVLPLRTNHQGYQMSQAQVATCLHVQAVYIAMGLS